MPSPTFTGPVNITFDTDNGSIEIDIDRDGDIDDNDQTLSDGDRFNGTPVSTSVELLESGSGMSGSRILQEDSPWMRSARRS